MSKRAERIRELEAELADLKDEEPRPLTLKEIKAMTPEQIKAEMKRMARARASEADDDAGDADKEPVRGTARMARGFAARPDPMKVHNERRGKGGAKSEEADDDE